MADKLDLSTFNLSAFEQDSTASPSLVPEPAVDLEGWDLGGFGIETKTPNPAAVFEESLKANPDREARATQLAREFQTTPDIVNADFDAFERKSLTKQVDFVRLRREAPVTSSYFGDFNKTVIVRDDLVNLEAIEKELAAQDADRIFTPSFMSYEQGTALAEDVRTAPSDRQTQPGYFGKAFEGLGQSIVEGMQMRYTSGIYNYLQSTDAPESIDDIIPEGAMPLFVPMQERIELSREVARNLGVESPEQFEQAREEAIVTLLDQLKASNKRINDLSPEGLDILQQGLRSGIESVAVNAPGFALALLSRNPAPALTYMFGQTYLQSSGSAVAEGLDYEDARLKGSIDGTIEVLTELLPADYLLDALKVGRKSGIPVTEQLRDIVFGYLKREVPGEQAATAWQSVNDQLFGLDEEMANAETPEEMAQIQLRRQAVAFVATLVAGSVQGGTITTAQTAANAMFDKRTEEQIRFDNEQISIDAIAQASIDSKLRERDISSFEEFVVNAEAGRESNIYLDGAQVSLFLQQFTQDQIENDAALKLLADKAAEAVALGTDVNMPVAKFASTIAPSEHFEQLRPTMSRSVDVPSPARIQLDQAAYQNTVSRIMAEANANVDTFAEATAIFESVKAQLIDTGRMSAQDAKYSAQIVPAYATVLAERSGMPVQQVYESLGLKIEGPMTGEKARLERELSGIMLDQPPAYRDAIDIYDTVRDDFLTAFPEDALFDEVMDNIDDMPAKYKPLLRALDEADWLGFEYPSQALDAIMSEEVDNYDLPQNVKAQLGRLVNGKILEQSGVMAQDAVVEERRHQIPVRYVVKTNARKQNKPMVVKALNEKNLERQETALDKLAEKFPSPLDSDKAWLDFERALTGDTIVPPPPYYMINLFNNMDQWIANHARMSQAQIDAAGEGFRLVEQFKDLYQSGNVDAHTTGKLMLWGMLSRMLSTHPHESAFIDAATKGGLDDYIQTALDREWTDADVASYLAWVETVIPDYAPGKQGTSNMNDFGKVFLKKMSKRMDDGRSALEHLHDMVADPTISTAQVRRRFYALAGDVGIKNKVLSFVLLLTGRDDVVVLDRIQINTMWDTARYGKLMYDDVATLFDGAQGLARYEALERSLLQRIDEMYAGVGRPDDASVGRYHWESWVLNSGQVVAHPTVQSLIDSVQNKADPFYNIGAPEGRYHQYAFGSIYAKDADGTPYIVYNDSEGTQYRFGLKEFKDFLALVKKPATGVVPPKFSVKTFRDLGYPWYEAQEVNRGRLDQLIAEKGERLAQPIGEGADTDGSRLYQRTGDGRGRDTGRGPAPLEGSPSNFTGPIPDIVNVAEAYAASIGLDYNRQGSYATVDPERGARIAQAYEEMEHNPNDPVVKEAFDNLINQTLAQYQALIDAGYTFSFFDEATDPYQGNPWNAMRDLRDNKTMAVYGTYAGYGTEGITAKMVDDNPMLRETGLVWLDQTGAERPVLANDVFRAVHDAFGHGIEGSGFRAQGEENAWQAHIRLFTGSAKGAITSETRGQNSWLNFGPYGEQNQTAAVEDTVFAEQKTGLMPEWTWAEGIVDDMPRMEQGGGTTRGYYDPNQTLIRLTEASDLSTFLHEFAHFMYEMELTQDSPTIQSIHNWFKRNAEDVANEANGYLDTAGQLEQSAGPTINPINNKPLGPMYRTLAPADQPTETRKVFKLMKVQKTRPGVVFPLFAKPESGPVQGYAAGAWYAAEDQQPTIGAKPLARRPGIHAVNLPVFDQGKAKVKGSTRVWVEVEMPAIDPNTQAESDNSTLLPNGSRSGITDRLIGTKEAYDYKTNPNASTDAGGWPIAGSMKVLRVVGDNEVEAMLRENNLEHQIENSMTGFSDEQAQSMSADMDKLTQSEVFEQSAYHGTPHRFDRFSLDAIGTGEGAQAYGWGLYFASNRGIAEWYRDQLASGEPTAEGQAFVDQQMAEWVDSKLAAFDRLDEVNSNINELEQQLETLKEDSPQRPPKPEGMDEFDYLFGELPDDPATSAWVEWSDKINATTAEIDALKAERRDLLDNNREIQYGISRDEMAAKIRDSYGYVRAMQDALNALDPSMIEGGNLFQVDLPEDNELLDWDKPLSQQPEGVRQKLLAMGRDSLSAPYRDNTDIKNVIELIGGDPTGERIVNTLRTEQRGQKAASLYLNSLGIKGLRYFDSLSRGDKGETSHNYVIWDEDVITVEAVNDELRQAEMLAQGDTPEGATGPITAGDVVAYLDNGTTGKQAKDSAIRRAVHEQFARGFEQYLMEGKAPSVELRNAFQKFAAWLAQIYRSMKSALRVNLDDEMRAVFDRLLATEEQIEIAKARSEFAPLFTDQAMSGMTDEEWQKYQDKKNKVTDKATETLRDKLIKEITDRTTKWWETERAAIEDSEAEKVKDEDLYVLIENLKTGDLKLDRNVVKALVGVESVDKRGRKSIRMPRAFNGMTDPDTGVDPDIFAEQTDYATGEALIKAIAEAPSVAEVARERAEEIMKKRHGDILNDGTIQREADEAVQNEERGELILAELRALNRATKRPSVQMQALKSLAEERVAGMTYSEVNPMKYRRAEVKAAREAGAAMAKGDTQAAADAKLRQAINYQMAMAATRAKQDTDKMIKTLARYRKKSVIAEIMRAGEDYWDQMAKILNRFELRKSASLKQVESLNEWMRNKIENMGEGIALDPVVLNEDYQKHWKMLTYRELKGVHDSLKNIEHVARYTNKIDRLGEKVEYETMVAQWLEKIGKMPKRFKPQRTTTVEKRSYGRFAMAQMSKIPWMASWLDSGERVGLSHDLLVQPFNDAQDVEFRLWSQIGEPLLAILDARSKADMKRHNTKLYIAEIKDDENDGYLMGHQVLAVALNTGNAGNLRKMLRGENWALTDEEVSIDNPKLQAVLKHMTKSDWDLVQAIWNQMDMLYPMLADVHRRTTGLTPPKVQSTPVKTPFGTYNGGYYPLKYDANRSQKAAEFEMAKEEQVDSLFGDMGIQASVTASATNERSGYFGPIKLSLEVVPSHFQETIHYIAFHDAVRQTNKLIRDKRIARAITEALGAEEFKQLKPWLNDIAKDGRTAPPKMFWDIALQRLRFGVTLGAMGFKASTGIIQVSGLSNTFAEVGVKHTLKGLRMVLGTPNSMVEAYQYALDNSKILAHRTKTFDREVRNAMQRIEGKRGVLPWIQEASMKHIAYIQLFMVDLPSWYAAYSKKLEETGDTGAAARYGDWVVEQVQGSGATKDMAAIMRGQTETGRMFTMFFTFFSALWNMERDLVKGAKGGKYSITTLAAKSMFLFVIPVLFEMIMRGELFDEDLDDEEKAQLIATKLALYPIASVPVVRDIVTGAVTDFGYNMSPIAQMMEKGVGSVTGLIEHGLTDDEITKGQAKGTTQFIGAAIGIPGTAQAWATGEHLYEVLEEGEDLTLRELLFGPKKD